MKLSETLNQQNKRPDPERFFESLYESAFPKVAQHIHHSGGDLDEAKDIFQDALVIFYEKSLSGKLVIEKSEISYILGIANHIWLRKTGKSLQTVDSVAVDLMDIPPEPSINELKLLRFLEVAGRKCLLLLQGFYYGNMNTKAIARKFGFSSERSATVQKYKCIEKIRKEINQKSMTYEDFIE